MVEIREDGYVEFRFFRPGASGVFLSGDFNGWRADQLRMVRQEDGYWALALKLPEGDHRFRYVADGLWYMDFAAFGLEPGRFGLNSVVRVPRRRLWISPAAPVAPGVAAEGSVAA